MVSPRISRLAPAGLVLLAAACQEATAPAMPESEVALARAQGESAADAPSPEALERSVPGFGGFFLDQDGNATMYLTRGNGRGPAERAVANYLARQGQSPSTLRVREARYAWGQLERWQAAVTQDVFDGEGVVSVDNDETRNVVRIGVSDLNGMGRARALVGRLGLSADAVVIEQVAPVVQLATLRDIEDRPVRAGVQIHFGGYVCSVGFNATRNGVKGFVTASHCTNTQGGVEGTQYYQPLSSISGTVVATETVDPTYFKGGACPRGRKCRYSDAAFAAYANGANQALGQIASTGGANNGLLTVTGTISITGESSVGGTAGSTANKIGRTTGWTSGVITNTCVHTGVQGSNIVQLCQNFVTAGVAGGDSGSDVFSGSGGNATLLGVLWGGSGNSFVFSPLGQVRSDLGGTIAVR